MAIGITKPIWEDTTYTDRSRGDYFQYYITTQEKIGVNIDGSDIMEEVTIFNGRAYAAPNEIYITININRICQDYLSTSLPYLNAINSKTIVSHKDAYRDFTLYDENDNILEFYHFLLDWSYEGKNFEEDINMARPINGHYAPNMLKMATYWESDNETVRTTISYDTNDVAWKGNKLYDKEACGEWALYYLNRYGGWDSFLIEQSVKKSDNYEKYFISRAYDNTTPEFGKMVYHNQITTTYEATTGWLSDRESDRLAFNLLSSNKVYLHNLKSGEIKPVVLTDTKAEYKTFKNNKRKMVNYTINIESSQIQQNIG